MKCAHRSAPQYNPAGVYFVITSNFPKGASFCAYHSFGTCNGTLIAVAYLPNVTGVRRYDIPSLTPLQSFWQRRPIDGKRRRARTVGIDNRPTHKRLVRYERQEVGDKCNFQFGSPVTLSNGSIWRLQERVVELETSRRLCSVDSVNSPFLTSRRTSVRAFAGRLLCLPCSPLFDPRRLALALQASEPRTGPSLLRRSCAPGASIA